MFSKRIIIYYFVKTNGKFDICVCVYVYVVVISVDWSMTEITYKNKFFDRRNLLFQKIKFGIKFNSKTDLGIVCH